MTDLMCPTCKLCRVCSNSRPEHQCPYPVETASYHKCPGKLIREQNRRVAKSARDDQAEESDRDMEVASTVPTTVPSKQVQKSEPLQLLTPKQEPKVRVVKNRKSLSKSYSKKEHTPSKRIYPKCDKCGHLMNFHKDGQCRMSRLKTGPCQCPNVTTSSNTPSVPLPSTGGTE